PEAVVDEAAVNGQRVLAVGQRAADNPGPAERERVHRMTVHDRLRDGELDHAAVLADQREGAFGAVSKLGSTGVPPVNRVAKMAALPGWKPRLTVLAEVPKDIVVAGGGVVVADDRQGVDEERPEVVDAAAGPTGGRSAAA